MKEKLEALEKLVNSHLQEKKHLQSEAVHLREEIQRLKAQCAALQTETKRLREERAGVKAEAQVLLEKIEIIKRGS